MKKLIMLMLAFAPLISACKKENATDLKMQVREIAWNSLSEQSKSTVTIWWSQATVIETTYNEKNVYAVTFNTSDAALLGPITVYVDKVSLVVLGQALRM